MNEELLGKVWPLISYEPSPKQEQFLRSSHKRRMLRAANRTGKTLTCAHEAWSMALGISPYKEQIKAPNIGLVVCPTWRSYQQVISAVMYETAPRFLLDASSVYTPDKGWRNQTIQLKNGSIIYFRTQEQGSIAIAGLTVDWLWVDEIPPPDIYRESVMRVSVSDGPVIMSFTPIGRPCDWMREKVEGDEEDWEQIVMAATKEDCPFRSDSSLEAQYNAVVPSERPQCIYGDWEGAVTDRDIECFDLDKIVDWELEDLGNTYIGLSMDHGEKKGRQTCLLVAYNRDLTMIVDEWVSTEATSIEDDAKAIHQLLRKHGLSIMDVNLAFGDINSAGKLARGRTVNQELGSILGITIRKAQKRKVSDHVYDMNQAFLSDKLFVHQRCKALTKSLMNWKHEPKYEDLKHLVDAAHYICPHIYRQYHTQINSPTYYEVV